MEIWKDIEGFPGYQVSSEGRVRSHNKVTYTKRHGARHWRDRIIKPKISRVDGRPRVCIWANGKEYTFLPYRLEAKAFMEEPSDPHMTINHKDGNPLNNNLDNLEWLSKGDNIRYGFSHGQYPQIACRLVDDKGNEFSFRSLSETSRFLGRSNGYVSYCISRGFRKVTGNGGIYTLAE